MEVMDIFPSAAAYRVLCQRTSAPADLTQSYRRRTSQDSCLYSQKGVRL